MNMKKALCFLIMFLFVFSFSTQVFAVTKEEDFYEKQFEQSGAKDLPEYLPDDTKSSLEDLGIQGANWEDIVNITPKSMFEKILSIAGGEINEPLRAAVSVIAVMLLCALLDGMKISFGDQQMSSVIGMVATLCICVIIINPIVSCIASAATVIKAAAGFLLACVPVITGIMLAAGQPVAASSYNLLMMAAGDVISIIASNILVPLMNIFLAISIVSAISPNINLNGLCQSFNKVAKWIMGFCMTVFTGLITVHSLVSSAMDTTGTRAAKFVVSSFVPVVGNALGEAIHTVNGCVKMLKSGVSAFGLLAGLFIFLPIIIQSIMWLLTIHICAGIGDVFGLKEVTSLLRASIDVIETLLSIILCCMTILTVSTVVMLVIGGVT